MLLPLLLFQISYFITYLTVLLHGDCHRSPNHLNEEVGKKKKKKIQVEVNCYASSFPGYGFQIQS